MCGQLGPRGYPILSVLDPAPSQRYRHTCLPKTMTTSPLPFKSPFCTFLIVSSDFPLPRVAEWTLPLSVMSNGPERNGNLLSREVAECRQDPRIERALFISVWCYQAQDNRNIPSARDVRPDTFLSMRFCHCNLDVPSEDPPTG